MRVTTDEDVVFADPGSTAAVRVRIVNTGSIIDGLTARVIGIGDAPVRAEPALLPLFPAAEGHIDLALDLPVSQAAGSHPVTVEIRSHSTGTVEHADLQLDVAARPAVALQRTPRMIRARRSGRFVLQVHNRGNVPLDVALAVAPTEPGVAVRLSPETLRVEAGASVPVMAQLKGPRMITGTDIDRAATVELAARRIEVAEPGAEIEAPVELTSSALLQLRQRPIISRGLISALILMAIVAVWAAIFLLGLGKVFGDDPLTKTAPASFFPSSDAQGDLESSASTSPVGALKKDGLVPADVGGQIGGTVTAVSDKTPVGRILVEAYRVGPDGELLPDPISSAATQSDGSYSMAGLFPTRYKLKFSADGFEPVWYPGAKNPRKASFVPAKAQGDTEAVNVEVTGLPGSIAGTVDAGETTSAASTTVTARLLGTTGDGGVAGRAVTDGQGAYLLDGLPSPATYELSFVTPGYEVTKLVQTIDGGEDRLQPAVLLSAGGGTIEGQVSDENGLLGGVTVTTDVGGVPLTILTPTDGDVGTFRLTDLPTPGTYVVSFSAPDHGTTTVIVDLGAGEDDTAQDVLLNSGVGSVSGVVTGPGGRPLGGVTVTLGGASTPVGGLAPTTTTLTTGQVGAFVINDLVAPGSYTLTFSLPGFKTVTRPLTLAEDVAPEPLAVPMVTQLGTVRGRVVDGDGDLVVGATVTATNGTTVLRSTTSAAGGALAKGGYLLPDLEPGWYSITVSKVGLLQQTALVRVTAGSDRTRAFSLDDDPEA